MYRNCRRSTTRGGNNFITIVVPIFLFIIFLKCVLVISLHFKAVTVQMESAMSRTRSYMFFQIYL